MNLRVFQNSKGNLLIEISSPLLRGKPKWMVPMLSTPPGRVIVADPLLTVRFNDQRYYVPFWAIRRVYSDAAISEVGLLEEDHSRDVLNHILDYMAW